MRNIPLLIFDLICLPITIIRLFLIYFFGSRYNISSLQFLDVMNHATNKFFNQGQHNITIDTVPTDVRISINQASRINTELLNEYAKYSLEKNKSHENQKGGIFGQKKQSTIILHTNEKIPYEDIQKLQKILPKILVQISNNNINYTDTDNIDISKLDDEIKKELDFISFDLDNDMELHSISN